MSPGLGRSLEKGMATHSSILAWRISWIKEPGRLQSLESQRIPNTYTLGNWQNLIGSLNHRMSTIVVGRTKHEPL